jgi:hypothetical protein
MNLVILIPVVLLVVALVLIFGRRHKAGGSGLGDRSDATERPELRGTEQAKDRF